jgi:hypothetical protein
MGISQNNEVMLLDFHYVQLCITLEANCKSFVIDSLQQPAAYKSVSNLQMKLRTKSLIT